MDTEGEILENVDIIKATNFKKWKGKLNCIELHRTKGGNNIIINRGKLACTKPAVC